MESKVISYPGVDVTVKFDLKRCIHAAECVKGAPQVFNIDRKPWIAPDQGEADELVDVIHRCPSGALTYVRHDGGPEEPVPTSNSVDVVEDGPVYLRGDITILSSEGDLVTKTTRVALCRCGASENKPLCDGSHNKAKFEDPGAIQEVKMKPVEDAAGVTALTIKLAGNGPLLLDGPVTITSADGAISADGSKAALCRCGQSANKPFCDGTHKKIGFEA